MRLIRLRRNSSIFKKNMNDKHHSHSKLLSAVAITNIIALLALVVAVVFNAEQIKGQNTILSSQERIASANYVLQLSNELAASKYTAITAAIQNGTQFTPVISKTITSSQLENYMGQFETIGDLVQEGVIDRDMAYQEFSYDVA